jgi:hypothetical protein
MILQLYIERTEPPLNVTEVHPTYRSVCFVFEFWRENVSSLPIFCIPFYVYIKSRLFGELNGS